ncbi:cobyric acid synthase [Nocardioides bruguierae]|uniref:Cobyric acid synthase n=1 Tax=Nocardioides bruguierae TaxID=2945102 RepID=A0A9X2D8L5_9ACTN|nr:cobyric acid synthase [Nocardioides bruguierae]MCM0621341.1 cobyric acid synthase [Nocardioides bruguierae]
MTGLLVAGTTSDAGKSTVVTGLCRALARRGVRVAPFKAQNMSNNSMVVDAPGGLDVRSGDDDGQPRGAEIGRAQWTQAVAARAVPEVAMNPVLLKPGGDRRSHVVLLGQPGGDVDSTTWVEGRRHLAAAAHAAYADLASRYDLVIAEGAGSPAEVNLRSGDYVNMGLARAFDLPTVVVGDIDRGGVLAAFVGTRELLDTEDRALLAGWVVNKFRGDVGLLQPGLDVLTERTGLPVHGVLPWHPDVWLDSEDTLDLESRRATASGRRRAAVIRFPRVSNVTDADALGLEPDLDVVLASSPRDLSGADLVVLPGTRATLEDLAWLRSRGLDRAVREHAAAGRPVLGICGGCQMLGRTIEDPHGVEGEAGARVEGLGLLDVVTVFGPEKVLRRHAPAGYEIHHGRVTGDASLGDDGRREFVSASGLVTGTMVHGRLEDDAHRSAYLREVLGVESRASFPAARERRIDVLADLVEAHLDVDGLLALATDGLPGARP